MIIFALSLFWAILHILTHFDRNTKLVHLPLMGGTARRDLGGLGPRPVPSSLYQM